MIGVKKYSFVIPTFKNKELLKNTLEFLNFQKGYGKNDYEVIVVDDGSQDDTWEEIKNINENYELKYIYLERNSDSCRSRARNFGWKAAEGEIIIFVDSDIIVRNNYLYEVDRCYSFDRDLLVIGTRLMLPDNTVNYNEDEWYAIEKKAYNGGMNVLEIRHLIFEYLSYNLSVHRFPWMNVFSCNMVVPREWLEKVDGFDESFKGWGKEDVDLGYRLYKAGIKIIVNNRLEVLHQYHSSSAASAEKDQTNKKQFLKRHPEAFEDLQKGKEFASFRIDRLSKYNDILEQYKKNRHEYRSVKTIDLKEERKYSEIKEEIRSLLNESNSKIIINDCLENTDIDIWVQLIELGDSSIEYHPQSKVIKFNPVFSIIDKIITNQ